MNVQGAFEEAHDRRLAVEAGVAKAMADIEACAATVASIEANMGERVLAGTSADEVAAELDLARARLSVARATFEAAKQAVAPALAAERVAEAAVLQEEAEAKRAELAELDAECAPLLERLAELQGCRFEPAPIGRIGSSTVQATSRSEQLHTEMFRLLGRARILEGLAQGDRAVEHQDPITLGRTMEESRLRHESADVDKPRSLLARAVDAVKG